MKTYPTLSVQDGFIRASGLKGNNNTVPAAFEIHGRFSSYDVLRAWQRVVDAHEGLRMSITHHRRHDRFTQRVSDGGDSARFIQVIESPKRNPSDLATTLMSKLLRYRFDLTQAPLWRGFLIRMSGSSWLLGVGFNHVIMDGYSVGILSKHLAAALRNGSVPQVPQLGAYAQAERKRPVTKEQHAFWQEQYARRTPLATTWKGRKGHYHVVPVAPIEPELVSRIGAFADSVKASTSTLFAAVAALASAAVLESSAPMLGFATAQRSRENEEVFGPLHDHLPVFGGAPENVTFAEFVNGMHQRRALSRRHRLPSWRLEEIAQTTPYDVAVNFSPFPPPVPHDAGNGGSVILRPIPAIGRVRVARATNVAPVVATILRPSVGGPVSGDVTGISSLHSEQQIRAMAAAIGALVRRGLARPDAEIRQLMQRKS